MGVSEGFKHSQPSDRRVEASTQERLQGRCWNEAQGFWPQAVRQQHLPGRLAVHQG